MRGRKKRGGRGREEGKKKGMMLSSVRGRGKKKKKKTIAFSTFSFLNFFRAPASRRRRAKSSKRGRE